jgi:ADP-ribose pyrophosphatase YjhB (NUDIX family)
MDKALNPALAEARFCPRCSQTAEVDFPRRIICSHCGYAAYYNPKPVACAIPIDGEGRVILLRRGFDPGRGLWTFPGGFVDLGESVEEAVHRETDEELCLPIALGALVGVYSSGADRVVLIVYRALALRFAPSPRVRSRGKSSRFGLLSGRCATLSLTEPRARRSVVRNRAVKRSEPTLRRRDGGRLAGRRVPRAQRAGPRPGR